MNTFAKVFKSIITITSIKLTSLAKYLNYDISYLSKWASGKSLPAKSNIDEICNSFATFVMLHCSETDLKNLLDYLQLPSSDSFDIKVEIKMRLLNAYYECVERKTIEPNDNNIRFLPTHLGNNLHFTAEKAINSAIEQHTPLQMLISGAPFSMADKFSYYRVVCQLFDLDPENVLHGKLLLSSQQFEQSVPQNITMLVHIILKTYNTQCDLYITDDPIFTEVNIFLGYKAIISNYFDSRRYLLTFDVYDKDEIEHIYLAYEKLCGDRFKPLVDRYDGSLKLFSSYYAGTDFHHLMYVFTELFMPRSIYARYLQSDTPFNIFTEIRVALSFPTTIWLGKGTLFQFFRTGQVMMFGNLVTLDPEARIEYVSSLLKILREHPHIQLFLVYQEVHNLYEPIPICYSTSSSSMLIRAIQDGNSPVAFSIQEKSILLPFLDELERLSTTEDFVISSDREQILQRIEVLLNEFRNDIHS